MRLTWAQPEDLLAHELVQSAVEGKDTAGVMARWVEAGGDPTPAVSGAGPVPASPELREFARTLLDELDALPGVAVDYAPPVRGNRTPASVSDETLTHRLDGAWTGRAAGCLLGKPVEKIPRAGIEEILRATGRWPLNRWFTAVGLPDDVAARWPWNKRSRPTSLEENIDGMPEDDDLNYPMLSLALLERHGPGFTTEDLAQLWLENLPAGRVFTAERAAYRNILDARPISEVATYRNPFREWIGALIRADVYGWVSVGDVDAAAQMARVDAELTHTRDGVHGAMWAAALTSSSMVRDDVTAVLDDAETVIPDDCELAKAARFGRRVASEATSVPDGLDRLHEEYGHLHWVHVLNNAATIAFALARGDGAFGPSISIAVMAGWDTDSVAATVGSVVGALRGREGIGAEWSDPLKGRIGTSLPGGDQAIADLVRRTVALRLPASTDSSRSIV